MQIYPIPNHATLPDMPSATNDDHDGRYYTESEVDTMLGDGTVDHGNLAGLTGQGAGGGANDHGLGSDDSPSFAALTATGTVQGEQLTSTDDITMQGHLFTMGDAGAATDSVMSFLGSTNSGSITYDESADKFDFSSSEIIASTFTAGTSSSYMSETDVGVNTDLYVGGNIEVDGNISGDTIVIPTNSASALTIRTAVPKTAILISTNLDPFVIDFNKAALVGMSRWALYDELGTGGELLSFRVDENLTGNKNLDFVTGDANRMITLSGNPTLGDWFDQAVKQASSPTFNGLTVTTMNTYTFDQSVASGATGVVFDTLGLNVAAAADKNLWIQTDYHALNTVGSKTAFGTRARGQNTANSGNALYGFDGQVQTYGNFNYGSVIAQRSQGVHIGGGTVPNMYGSYNWLYNFNGGSDGTITNAYGFYSLFDAEDGTIGTGYGFYAAPCLVDNGTFTTMYAFYDAGQTGAGTNWSFYSAGGNSYFAGNILSGADLTFNASVDSAAVADEVSIGGYEIGAGNRVLAISSETTVAAEVDETKFSHKLQVRINGATYYLMLTAT